MTIYELFDSIGNVDDVLIEKAIEPEKAGKKTFRIITSVAACAVLLCAAVLIVQNINKSNSVVVDSDASSAVSTSQVSPADEESHKKGEAGGSDSEAPVSEEPEESAPDEMDFVVYYIADGKLVSEKVQVHDCFEAFNVWKKENHIGKEVKLISVEITDNSTTDVSEYSGERVAAHTTGDKTSFIVTVTKNIEKYYSRTGKVLLLESLEKTMTSIGSETDDYQLILSDDTENPESKNTDDSMDPETSPTKPEKEASSAVSQEYTHDKSETEQSDSNYSEESESNHVDPEDIQYNDQGEALE